MIDIAKIRYRLIVLDEKGKKHDITSLVTDLEWKEMENEIAASLSCTVYNRKTEKERISKLVKIGTQLLLFATDGGKEEEVIRAKVVEWNSSFSNSYDKLTVRAYDNLYDLQQSYDSLYYSKGLSTHSILQKLLTKWGLKMGEYKGKNITHGKIKHQNSLLTDVLRDILKEVKRKSGKKCLIRSQKEKIDFIPYGHNKKIYHFENKNVIQVEHSISTSDLVTRVKIVSSDEKKQKKIEVVLNGQTKKYGIRQKIVIKNKKEKLIDVKKEAQQILDEKGHEKHEFKVTIPDIPFVRKGDVIFIQSGTLNGYYYIFSISHKVTAREMYLELKKAKKVHVIGNTVKESKNYKVGDIVSFDGGKYYISSQKGAKEYDTTAGKAKITIIKKGTAHPYHLIHMDNKSKVYGWVDEGSF